MFREGVVAGKGGSKKGALGGTLKAGGKKYGAGWNRRPRRWEVSLVEISGGLGAATKTQKTNGPGIWGKRGGDDRIGAMVCGRACNSYHPKPTRDILNSGALYSWAKESGLSGKATPSAKLEFSASSVRSSSLQVLS